MTLFHDDINAIVTSSFAGYINLGPPGNSAIIHNVFFWYFPAEITSNQLIFYLNGGPGCTSLLGLFKVNGPIYVDVDFNFAVNPSSWHKNAHVVYVDQPIFTGFSFSNTDPPLINELQISNEMYNFIFRFMYIFNWLQDAKVILAVLGHDSYAGQYIPYMANAILTKNVAIHSAGGNEIIKLVGLGIGAAWFNQKIQYLSYYDLINSKNLTGGNTTIQQIINQRKSECLSAITQYGELTSYIECERVLDELMSWIDQTSGTENCFNYYDLSFGFQAPKICVDTPQPSDYLLYTFITDENVRNALHVNVPGAPGINDFNVCSQDVWYALTPDGSLPSHSLLFQLVNQGIQTILWSGTDDFIVNSLGIENSIAIETWGGAMGFQSPLSVWNFNGNNLGYYASERGLSYYRISNVGHFTIGENPYASSGILNKILQLGTI
ncbi:Cell death protease [Nowakowskiella sp. JEL0078]|nr:Cell death protease [Nowakowskiella sp. JEL0078]